MEELMTQRIKEAIDQIGNTLKGDRKRIDQMISLFIVETPSYCQQLNLLVDSQDWSGTADLLHKIKSRFGYLNLDDKMMQLSEWEEELRMSVIQPMSVQHERTAELQNLTKTVVGILESVTNKKSNVVAVDRLPLADKTVLVAEDDEINAMVFELFIIEIGGRVIKASDGRQAVQFAMDEKPDLIFMDVHMPFFSGLDAIKALREQGVTCPIISLSASTRLNEKQNSLDAGANDFLIKPASRVSINQILLKYLH